MLPPEPLGPLLFLCWETGFAAVQSLLEQALALGPGGPLRILWFARDGGGRYLRNYCRALADSEDAVEYRGVDLDGPERVASWLAANRIRLDPVSDVFGVLPQRVLGAVESALGRAGAEPARLRLAAVD